jgi:UDP-glucose 4-epimerase
MEVLLTGGCGYIGSHVAVVLLEAGYSVVCFDNFQCSSRAIENRIRLIAKCDESRLTVLEGDVRKEQDLLRAFETHPRIEAVIHLAALKNVGESVSDPLSYFETNIGGTISLLKVMTKFRKRKLIFSSSCTVYGESRPCVREHDPVAPINPYGQTKATIERMLLDICSTGALEACILRYFNPIGAHASGLIGDFGGRNLVPIIVDVCLGKREQLDIFGIDYDTSDGSCLRDYIHVMDVAEAHLKAIEMQSSSSINIINIGTGVPISVLELVKIFARITKRPVPYRGVDRRKGDCEKIFCDVRLAQELLGWSAKRDAEAMVRDAWTFACKGLSTFEDREI